MARPRLDVAGDTTYQAEPIGAPEIAVESESALVDESLELEKFMNEKVKIVVFDGGKEGDVDIIQPEVNGEFVVIKRNEPTVVKRKFVEALARAKTFTYGQRPFNPHDQFSLHLIPRAAQSYPFQLVEDSNPKGPAWLRSITEAR